MKRHVVSFTAFMVMIVSLTVQGETGECPQRADGITAGGGFIHTPRQRSAPFLTRQANRLVGRDDPLIGRYCAITQSLHRLFSLTIVPCPPTLIESLTVRNYLPPPVIVANLPHLRMDIVLRRMEHIGISGGGVSTDPDAIFDNLWATWLLKSTAATVQVPDVMDNTGFGLPVPPNPGEIWDDIPHANLLYRGIIANGCGSQTVFDVVLKSTIIRTGDNTILGQVEIPDQVVGAGYHTFAYTIRATDDKGGVSDFVFSGEVRVYCFGQSSF